MINFNMMTDSTSEWMEEHGYWGNGPLWDEDKPCRHGEFDYDGMHHVIVAGHSDDEWFAEDTDENFDAETQTDDIHPDLAIIKCLSYLIAPTAFEEEGNCEDAVTRVAYNVFSLMYRNENVVDTAQWPTGQYENTMFDMMLGAARKAVKFFAGDAWIEF